MSIIMGPNETREVHAILTWAMGEEAMEALRNPTTNEVTMNSDGKLWIDDLHKGKILGRDIISSVRREIITTLCAQTEGVPVGAGVAAVFPLTGDRFQASMSTIHGTPAISLRKHSVEVRPFQEWIDTGRISKKHAFILLAAVRVGASIALVGMPKSGKTTMLNSLANEIEPHVRVVTIEDTQELRLPKILDWQGFVTSKGKTIIDHVREAMRQQPDRIIVGEARTGDTLLEALKVTQTGCRGLMISIHAGSSHGALPRMERLLHEVHTPNPRGLIADTVEVVVFMKDKHVREVMKMKKCIRAGYGQE